ncbi:cytochrome c biogenesis heme-transporting ATPase CcmA [Vibrio sp. SM6]|uniref:Cytochrome c biogenesis heme-transporting ATPase CcmA n=1 Tax=Vibrio agarilyticus TaxID=2726741 RepID=A0A7X8YGQ6_9VIBR|nr:cytochrome c biogenesis heme-transporting ATPase CcmA [Vibrio agarilyticus]NLS13253.1 cytochrome c biogenesis heme-transporting ATPase CcmA [Vibrio agarilyticus]
MLSVVDLTAIRDDRVLFERLSFLISPGEIVQIEGRNGTGKTTLLRILTGLGHRDDGEVRWCDEPIEACRDDFHHSLLYLGHHTGVKRELTALENLSFFQSLNGGESAEGALFQALAQVGLAGREDVPAGQLSAGQQRRVALARLWLSDHKLWILDEPLTAIDKQGVKVLERLFVRHAEDGGIVVLTTHQDMFADHAALRKIKLGD